MDGAPDQHGFTAVLASKLNPPRQALKLLKRERLLALLDWGFGPVMLLAPAGFGKTTLLGQRYEQLRSEGRTAVWLTADEDDDPDRILAHLLAGLAPYNATIAELQQRFARLGFGAKAARWSLMEALQTAPPVTIIIDDIHRVQNAEAQDLLQSLIESAPPTVSLLLGARSKPALRTGTLRAHGLLREIGPNELRFTQGEAADYFQAEFPRRELDRLMQYTEGWPVALQLWRLYVRERSGAPEPKLVGGPAALSEYLAEEIFSSLKDTEREFLLYTSILEEVNGRLADALTLRNDGSATLHRIHELNLPISCTDLAGEWYRYHRLFADFLQEKLTKTQPHMVATLHRNAAEWFANNGRFQDALRHAFGTGDPHYVVCLVEKLGGWQLALTGGVSILRRLAEVDLGVMEKFPRARMGQIYLMAQDGHIGHARAAFEALRTSTGDFENVEASASCPGLKEESVIVDSVIRIYEDLPLRVLDIEKMRSGTGESGPLRGPAGWLFGNLLCYAYFDSGDYDRSRSLGYRLLEDKKLEAIPYAQNYLYAYMAISCLRKGRLEEGANLLRTMRKRAESLFGPTSNQAAISALLLAEIRMSRGDRNAAKKLVQDSLGVVEQTDGWFDIYASGYQTSSALAELESGSAAATDVWERALVLAEERGLDRLRKLARIELARVLARSQQIKEALAIVEAESSKALQIEAATNARELLVPARLELARAWLLLRVGEAETSLECARRLRVVMHRFGLADRTLVETALVEAAASHALGDDTAARRIAVEMASSGRTSELELAIDLEGDICGFIQTPGHTAADVHRRRGASEDAHPGRSSEPQRSRPAGNLTSRELNIACELADGFSNKEIAQRLKVAPATVKVHRRNIYRKLGVRSRAGVVSYLRTTSV